MSMNVLKKYNKPEFPLNWVDLEYFPNSLGGRKEIYLKDKSNKIEDLILLFYLLFGKLKDELLIYDNSWWDFPLETWNCFKNEYDYKIENKSKYTSDYLRMLEDSKIEVGYSGNCKCEHWDTYLLTVLRCVVNHEAPYSPILYHEKCNFFFYFHHSGSIGFYYHEENILIEHILKRAHNEFILKN